MRSLSETDPRSGRCGVAAGAGPGHGALAPPVSGGTQGAWPHGGGGGSMAWAAPARKEGGRGGQPKRAGWGHWQGTVAG